MNTKAFSAKKLLSLMLAITMMLTVVLPASIFASNTTTITTTLGNDPVMVGEEIEFSVSINASDPTTSVLGNFQITADEGDVALFEYFDNKLNIWEDLPVTVENDKLVGNFGNETTGGTGETTGGTGETTGGTGETTGGTGETTGGTGETTGGTDETTGGTEETTGSYRMFSGSRVDSRIAESSAEGDTYLFKLEFAKPGVYSAKISAYDAQNNQVLCEENLSITVIDYADYTDLDSAILIAEGYNKDDYTDVSYNALKTAIDNAKAVDRDLTETEQGVVDALKVAIDEAIAGLVTFVDIEFTATAVADDVSNNYAKANKIVVVFSEPLADGSESILKDVVNVDATVSKVSNSVYTFELASNHNLTNGMTFTVTPEQKIFTASGKAINACSAKVVGNIEDTAELVTANAMTATIVNIDDKPYMVNGDKIVLVFNAPVYGNPASIEVSGMTATVVANTYNTIYEIALNPDNHNVKPGCEIVYGDIKANLKGTFGGTVVPEVVRALVEDVDGTAKTAGDKINVFFNAPTNKVAGTTENTFTDVLAGATGEWLDNQTLVITLGNTAITVNDKIDLSNLGIKDFYGTEDADAADIELEGSFGVAIEPKLLTVTAISKSGAGTATKGDEIHLSFNVKMREDALDIIDDFDFDNGNYGSEGASVAWASGEEYADYSTIIITLGNDPQVVPGETVISIKKELYEETGIKACNRVALQNRKVAGTFGTTVAPELLSASIVKNKPVVGPQNGDQIVLLFNVPTNGKNIDNLIKVGSKSLGTGYEGNWNNDFTVYTIELGSTPTVEGGDTIEFDNDGTLKDRNNQKQAKSNSVAISGSFGEEAAPVGISPSKVTATIVKATAVAGPQAEDKIVFAFNVATNGAEDLMLDFFNAQGNKFGNGLRGSWNDSNTIYTLYLGIGATVTDRETITFTSQAGIQDKDSINDPVTLTCTLIGSFGIEITPVTVAPSLLDAVIIKGGNTVGATKGDKIQFIFNMAINDADLYAELGGVNVFGAESNGAKDNNIYTITIGNNANIPASFNITAAAGLKDAAEFSEAALIPNIVLTGSFGDEIKPVTAAPTLFKAVIVKATDTVGPQAGDKIQLVFNMAINNADLFAALGGKAVFGAGSYGSADSNIYTITLGTGITSIPTTFSINSDAGLKDASGYSANAVIPNFTLVGSFGETITPSSVAPALLSATIVKGDVNTEGEAQAGDKVVFAFNMATNKADLFATLGGTALFGSNAPVQPAWNEAGNIYTVTLGDNATITDDTILEIKESAGLKDSQGYSASAAINNIELIGSFGVGVAPVAPKPALKNATIVKDSGMLGIHAGDKIVLTFNVATNGFDLLNTIDFAGRDGETLGTGARGRWISDIKYEIVLGVGAKISEDAEQTAIMQFIHHGNLKDKMGITAADDIVVDEFVGSFGVAPELKLEKAIIVKGENNTIAKAQKGDMIILSFSSKTNTTIVNEKETGVDIAAKLGIEYGTEDVLGEWSNDFTIYTITLGTNPTIKDGTLITIPDIGLTGFDGGVFAENSVTLESSFGKVNTPVVISAIAYSDVDYDYIDITFNIDTNTFIEQGSYLFIPETRDILGHYSINWNKGPNVLTIVLGDDHEFKTDSVIKFADGIVKDSDSLGVLANNTIVENVKGELRKPYVTSVVANYDKGTGVETLTVTFSSKTNKPKNIDLSAQYSSLGRGATATWIDTKTLVITLGKGRTISVNGTGGIILNGLGITNGFDTNEVVGQYSITDGTLKEYDLEIADARVNRTAEGDKLTVTFTAATNMYGKKVGDSFAIDELLAESAADSKVVPTKTFGTGATAVWESASKLVITLGEGSTFRNANDTKLAENSKIMFRDLKFANGLGLIKAEAKVITGSFDGREVRLNNLAVATANEYTTATVKVDKQEFEYAKDAIVTFVIWDAAKETVTDINAVKVNMAAVDSIEVSSKFAEKDYSKVEVYVTDAYIDAIDENTTFGVLANTVTANKEQ